MKEYTLIYQDHRPRRFIKDYLRGMANVVLSKPGEELVVNEAQMKHLLKFKNGTKPCFVLKRKPAAPEGGEGNATRV